MLSLSTESYSLLCQGTQQFQASLGRQHKCCFQCILPACLAYQTSPVATNDTKSAPEHLKHREEDGEEEEAAASEEAEACCDQKQVNSTQQTR